MNKLSMLVSPLLSPRRLIAFYRDESGVTAIEYALIAALIAVAIIGVLITVGGDLKNVFNSVGNGLTNAGSNASNSN